MKDEYDEQVISTLRFEVDKLTKQPTPLHALVLIGVWRKVDTDELRACPVMVSDPDALLYLVETLRDLVAKIEQGDYVATPKGTTSPGGDA
jgi:hypothetical protein